MDIDYCCDGFRNAASEAGKTGLAVLPICDPDGVVRFRFQSRGCDFSDLKKLSGFINALSPEVRKSAPRVNLIEETGLQFCPWCGAHLADLIARNENAFRERAMALQYLTQEAMATNAQ